MFDGSSLPLEESLRISSEFLDECARAGVVLEVECGVVGGAEDDVSGESADEDRLYTTTQDLLRVAEVLGTGERGRYLLAATFGNVHGLYAPGSVDLRPGILLEGQDALAAAHAGARSQYVFHGSSGSSEQDRRDAVRHGVVKVNVDTDMQYAFTRAVADHVLTHYAGVLKMDGGVGDKTTTTLARGGVRRRPPWQTRWRSTAPCSGRRAATSHVHERIPGRTPNRRFPGKPTAASGAERAFVRVSLSP
jgi:fructose-bisphosphate aldolase, class II